MLQRLVDAASISTESVSVDGGCSMHYAKSIQNASRLRESLLLYSKVTHCRVTHLSGLTFAGTKGRCVQGTPVAAREPASAAAGILPQLAEVSQSRSK